MKKNYINLVIIEIIMLLIISFNTFISSIFTTTNILYIMFWILLFIAITICVGFAKDKYLYKIDILQIVFIYSTIYLLATYIFGFFFGFVRSPYNLSFLKIIQNIIPILLVIVFQELVRHNILAKGKEKKAIIISIVLIFIVFDIAMGFKSYPISDGMSIFEMIGLLIIPSISKNLLLTYISLKNGFKPAIMYRVIFELTIYCLPFFPDLGIYLESILNIVFPIILFLKLNTFFAKVKPTTTRVSKIKSFIFWIPTTTILVTIVILVSGIFKFYAMAIGSPSMVPNINKGDVVIIEKLTDEQMNNLSVGEIIAFEYDKKIIVHRIIKIDKKSNKYVYQTKGDNNDDPDAGYVEQSQIKGIVSYRIPIIGYPSVWLSELLN
jgi:signal peptidase I, archaeal type